MNGTATVSLTQQQIALFKNDGYLVVENLFDDSDLNPVIDEINTEINRHARELVAAGELSRTYEEEGFERQLTRIHAETPKVTEAISHGKMSGPAFFNMIRNPKLLDIAGQFCGSEVIASSVYRLRPKMPCYKSGEVPWHQDSGYIEEFCDRFLIITVWLPLVDAGSERGCLWVIPDAHKGEVLRHAVPRGNSYLEIPEPCLPRQKPICVPVKKGGALFMTNLTPHASFENVSDVVRWSMDLRYQSAELPTNAKITRLEGEVIGTPDWSVPMACYPPEADFLVRSAKRPNEVVTDPAEFHRLRKTHLKRQVTRRWDY